MRQTLATASTWAFLICVVLPLALLLFLPALLVSALMVKREGGHYDPF